jgi:XTP/dITP diphosphohydrolase
VIPRLVVATRNPGKVVELARLVAFPGITLATVDELDPSMPDVVEDADSFEGNAIKKASEVARHFSALALGDDSGLEVDALGGAPGIHSARWSGGGAKANVEKLLRELESVEDARRTARFRCVLALVDPNDASATLLVHGTCEGRIARAPRGVHGFGYDPVFVPSACDGRTMAELGDGEKDAVSHRGLACRALAPKLGAWLAGRA